MAADIDAIRSAGGDVAVSFGGYNGTELGTTCGSASALANAYQQVITKYDLKRVDFDYENGALDSNTAIRFGAIRILEQNNPNLTVSLTIPMTTVGFPGSGTDEIQQADDDGARLDIINIMDFDTGLTSGTEVAQTEAIANDAIGQLESIYGWSAATAWSHLGLQIMNGHTDQPSELFTQDTFNQLLAFARANHPAWFSFWSDEPRLRLPRRGRRAVGARHVQQRRRRTRTTSPRSSSSTERLTMSGRFRSIRVAALAAAALVPLGTGDGSRGHQFRAGHGRHAAPPPVSVSRRTST